jgi:hypothetical protein
MLPAPTETVEVAALFCPAPQAFRPSVFGLSASLCKIVMHF